MVERRKPALYKRSRHSVPLYHFSPITSKFSMFFIFIQKNKNFLYIYIVFGVIRWYSGTNPHKRLCYAVYFVPLLYHFSRWWYKSLKINVVFDGLFIRVKVQSDAVNGDPAA